MYVRVYDVIELDTIAEMSSESASTRSRINLVVIRDENRKIINATAPSKLRPSITYKGVLAEREIEWLIVTLTNFARRRRRIGSLIPWLNSSKCVLNVRKTLFIWNFEALLHWFKEISRLFSCVCVPRIRNLLYYEWLCHVE